jgi:integral membrane protein
MENSNQNMTNWFLKIGKIEGYSYLILLCIAMPLKYMFNMPEYVRPVGMLHGLLFVAFMILLALMFFKVKMSFKNAALSFLLSLVPFGTFFLKRLV